MGRRRGFFAELEHQRIQQQKQAARFQRENDRLAAQARRAKERQIREADRADKQAAREAAAEYLRLRQAETDALNEQLTGRVRELDGILIASLARSVRVPFASLRQTPSIKPFQPGKLAAPLAPPAWEDYAPPAPKSLQRLFKKTQLEREQLDAAARFESAQAQYAVAERDRLDQLQRARAAYEAKAARQRLDASAANAKVDEFERAYLARSPEAINDYFELMLESRDLPAGLPADVEVAFQADNGRLLVVMELPGVDVIPPEVEHRYVRTKDEIVPKARPARDIAQRYTNLVAQLVLCTIRDIYEVAAPDLIAEVAISAHVATRNRATGRPERPCLVSVLTTREQFSDLVLVDLDPVQCLRHLNALISPHPHDLEAVRPVFDPDLSKYKFVTEHDAAVGLDSRTVLVDMPPTEFEHLVRQLFEAMGMKSWVTQASRDDGVDGVAFNEDPIMGGVCVIQAKRYKNIVPADAVRALAGVMGQKKASRGVLVTTSWYGKATIDFADDHGRIQLIDGQQLKYMLKEHLGLDVVIGELNRRRQSS
ncbi:restriction endonuclease [Kribbella monticola]|uniref:restriction endonuclease n=1 Tax=Kribbella monticola TaxID=2185285 RepID=UPI0018E518DE|nr:restriction endonuclease [Kribbella monticola]